MFKNHLDLRLFQKVTFRETGLIRAADGAELCHRGGHPQTPLMCHMFNIRGLFQTTFMQLSTKRQSAALSRLESLQTAGDFR